MFLKRNSTLGVIIFFLFSFFVEANAQAVTIASTGGSSSAQYANLTAAFNAINTGIHTGVITLTITANLNEGSGTAVLNSSGAGAASYSSVSIRPSVDNITISGTPLTGRGIIEFNGSDNVTIDGDNVNTVGTNRNLSVINNAATSVTFSSCIRLATSSAVTSCDNIIIRNCMINGNAANMNGVSFNTATGAENTSFGIYAGGNAGSTSTSAPQALTSVSANTIPAGATINLLQIDNCTVNTCARAIIFLGSAASSSTNITVSNNIIGASGLLSGIPPYTNITNTVYVKAISIQGTNAVTISSNTIQNVLSFVPAIMGAIELNAFIGSGTISILNNTISGVVQNSTTNNTTRGVYIAAAGAPYTIAGNNISNIQNLGFAFLSGIEVITTASSATIERNRVSTVYSRSSGTYGVYGINLNGGNSVTVRNNFISDLNHNMSIGNSFNIAYGIFGIRLAAGNAHRIHHNTVSLAGSMIGTNSSTNLTAALAISSSNQQNINIRNNILSNTMTGGTTGVAHVCVYIPSGMSATSNITLNNNAYFCGTDGTKQGVAFVGSTYNATALDGVASFNPTNTLHADNFRSYSSTLTTAGTNDNASFASSATAPFVSSTDFHINAGNALAPVLESRGANAAVTNDIDLQTRTTLPDIGADEFSMTACSTPAGGIATAFQTIICGTGSTTISASGFSFGQNTVYSWESSNNNFTGNVVATGQTNPVIFFTGNISSNTWYRLKTTCGASVAFSNIVAITFAPAQAAGINASATTICAGNSVTLTENGGTATSWNWTPGNFSSSSIVVSPLNTTTYQVTALNGACSTSTQLTVVVNPVPENVSVETGNNIICLGDDINLSGTASVYKNVLLNQNFNSGIAPWTAINNSTGGDDPAAASWTSHASGYLYKTIEFVSNDNTNFVMSNSDEQSDGNTNTRLISSSFSTVGYSNISMSFYHYYRNNSEEDTSFVEVSTDNINWTIIKTYGLTNGTPASFVKDSIQLIGYAGLPSVYLRFRYTAPWGWYWCIDNVQVTGETNAFTYAWTSTPSGFTSSLQNPGFVTPPAPGNYTYQLTITNNYNCSSSETANISVNSPVTVNAGINQTICYNEVANLSATVTGSSSGIWASEGDGFFANAGSLETTYSPGENDKLNGAVVLSFTSVNPPGTCAADTGSLTINIAPQLSATASVGLLSCSNGTSSVTVTETGGTAPFTYSVNGGSFQASNHFNLSGGTYIFTVKDASDCTAIASATVEATNTLTAQSSADIISCNGGSTTVNVTASGGTAPYTGTGNYTRVAGTYIFTVTDANGCSAQTNLTISQPATLLASSSAGTISCNGGSTTVNVTASGGTAPYTGTGSFTRVAGTHTFFITDANGCSAQTSLTISQPATLLATSSAGTISCNGGSTTVNVTASGGTAPYTGTGSFTRVAGTHTFFITDANGCSAQTSVIIANGTGNVPSTPAAITGNRNNACGRTITYSVRAVPGATSYTWTIPSNCTIVSNNGRIISVAFPSNFVSGTISVTANNSCGSSTPRILNVAGIPTKPVISGPVCLNNPTAGAIYTVMNPEPGVTYNWTMPSGAVIVSGQGTSTVIINWGRSTGASISVRGINTCGTSSSGRITITVGGCFSVTALSIENIQVNPNPTQGLANVQISVQEETNCSLILFDAAGKKLQQKQLLLSTGMQHIALDLTSYPAGIYMLSVQTQVGMRTIKVVKVL